MAFILLSEASVESYFELQVTQYWEYDQITFKFVFFSVFLDLDMALILLLEASVYSNLELQIIQHWKIEDGMVLVWGSI